MPNIFLSPATYHTEREAVQAECHAFEQYLVRSLTDLLEMSLQDADIQFVRRAVDTDDLEAIVQSNLGEYALHLALHVNMAPDCLAGAMRGIQILYSPYSEEGELIAKTLATHLQRIYPLPDLITLEANEAIEQLTAVNSPAVMLLLGYRDSAADAEWLQRAEEEIARTISQAIEEYFNTTTLSAQEAELITQPAAPLMFEPAGSPPPVPCDAPKRKVIALRRGLVRSAFGGLVIRSAPDHTSSILKTIPNGSILTVLEDLGIWCQLRDGEIVGFALTNSLLIEPLEEN